MDLYEALKTGANPFDLEEAFFKELEEAQAKLEEEKVKEAEERAKQIREAETAAANKEWIDHNRFHLATAIVDYAEAITGVDEDGDFETYEALVDLVEGVLKGLEENISSNPNPSFNSNSCSCSSSKQEKEVKEKKEKTLNKKQSSLSDDDIIAAFLASLK